MSCERIFEPTCLIHDPVGSSRGPCTRLALDVDENKKGFLNIKLTRALRNRSYHLLLGDLTDHSIVCYVECELEKEYIAWLDTTDHSKEWFHFNLGAPIKSAKFASTIKGYEIKKGCLFQVKWIQQNGETWGLLSRIDRSIIP